MRSSTVGQPPVAPRSAGLWDVAALRRQMYDAAVLDRVLGPLESASSLGRRGGSVVRVGGSAEAVAGGSTAAAAGGSAEAVAVTPVEARLRRVLAPRPPADAAVLASLCGSDAETGSGAPQGAERVGTGCVG
ncbi:MAG: hypothetical protein M3Q27_18360, partial [Actinomycetota bacterium]|nr:hypothetical protein [Actinomycetota bacterium]